MKEKIAIYGSTHLTPLRLLDAINRQKPTWDFVGFVDDTPERKGALIWDHPVLGGREVIPGLAANGVWVFNNVTGHWSRAQKIAEIIEAHHCQVPNLIHPGVDVNYVRLGKGCLLPDNSVVGANSCLGNYVNLRLNSVLSHDVRVGDFVLVGPGANIAGRVTLQTCCFIGAGATILPELTIGEYAVVGAGAVVTRDVAPHTTVAGVPARELKKTGAQT